MMIWRISLSALSLAILWLPPSDDIAFASRRDGNWEIYVMDAAGQNQRRLTRRDAEDRFPLWSPDRQQIAFASLVGSTWELWVMDSDGRIRDASPPRSSRNQRVAGLATTDGSSMPRAQKKTPPFMSWTWRLVNRRD